MSNYIEVPFIKIEQPIGTFYVVSMSYSDVINISKADVRKLDDKDSIDNYIGFQRKISPARAKEIASYCTTIDATFPTGVILAIKTLDEDGLDNKNVIFASENRMLIKKESNIASILDGQHRLKGLDLAKTELGNVAFDLNVTIFLDADIGVQTQIFSVINKSQTKVNKSLVYDLYEYPKNRSPQKTCHNIVRVLNKNEKSPFYKKIKILGAANDFKIETIAQATLAELIMDLISKDPVKDRDILKRSSIKNFFSSEKVSLYESKKDIDKYIFREFFINDQDFKIVQYISTFFSIVGKKWPHSWNENKSDNILNKSTGVIALMNFLRDVFKMYKNSNENFESYCLNIFNKINIKDNEFSPRTFIPGKKGQSDLLTQLREALIDPKDKNICRKDHSQIASILKNLTTAQSGAGRHKCAGCAYEQGYQDGFKQLKNININETLKNLNESQAGPQRHKNAKEAYELGYQKGSIDSKEAVK